MLSIAANNRYYEDEEGEQIAVADRHELHSFTPTKHQSRRRLGSAFGEKNMKNLDEPDVEWSSLPGYEKIEPLLRRKTMIGCTLVRSLRVINYVVDGNFSTDVILDLVHDYGDRESLQIVFRRCHQITIEDTHQICGLAFRDVFKRGWDLTRFEVYDYEESKIGLFCHRIEFDKNTEQIAVADRDQLRNFSPITPQTSGG